jgi:starch phosphorylase
MLWLMTPEKLAAAAQNRDYLDIYDRSVAAFDAARSRRETWWSGQFPAHAGQTIAYFSAEFALHQSLPIYAGGLGVLAGDHCKESADLGVPLVGIGFMYPQGYFHQHLSADGWQQESYEQLNWDDAPIEPAVGADDLPLVITVPLGQRTVHVAVWKVTLSRVTLYLLDTNREENAPWDRELSARLYGGDQEMRIQQEVILGVGGVRALKALGFAPSACHLNEGHAAFVVLQRLCDHIEQGKSFADALDEIRNSTIFTTHTPVPAGHDAFSFDLVNKHLAGCWGALTPYHDQFMALGSHDSGGGALFNMTALALRSSTKINAVSELHGHVTRAMWTGIWPGVPVEQTPVASITNGVHVPTWLAPSLNELFARYLGSDWRRHHDDPALWEAVLAIPDAELWQVRRELRRTLFTFIRNRARNRWTEEKVSTPRIVAAGTLLDPDILTIGFARRFTDYKRPELVFHDPDRLARILNSTERPVQMVFAGKAHPNDDSGKHHLQNVYAHALDPKFGGRLACVDDYDLFVAHFFTQGCDIWLNTPRKPLEASGTSGMKAALNGVLHLSVGDGWWAEGFNGHNGWLIDGGDQSHIDAAVDAADAAALYRLLEEQIVPAFYERDRDGTPARWMATIKESIRTVAPRFSARRMVKEYATRMYAPTLTHRAGRTVTA